VFCVVAYLLVELDFNFSRLFYVKTDFVFFCDSRYYSSLQITKQRSNLKTDM